MGIRFKKTIKLGNLVKLNISKSGVSLTAGVKGASINLGKGGTYLNLSPTLAGIKGTGVSYRQKLAGGYEDALEKVIGKTKVTKKDNETSVIKDQKDDVPNNLDTSVIDEYLKKLETTINIHKYTDNVLNKEAFDSRIAKLETPSSKEIYQLLIDGDEETIETSIGAYLNELDVTYPVNANFELEDHQLYVDLDLPEIEDVEEEYPSLVNDKVVLKKKSSADVKKEYALTVMSLGTYLAANFFNRSSYIDEIIMSAFTSRRNNDGDLQDQYLYSVKFLREEFEKTNLNELDDIYNFLLKFENRINMQANFTFKAIKPYEMASVQKNNSLIEEAVEGLKELGYKANAINEILPKLNEMKLESSGAYVKEALKLLTNK